MLYKKYLKFFGMIVFDNFVSMILIVSTCMLVYGGMLILVELYDAYVYEFVY